MFLLALLAVAGIGALLAADSSPVAILQRAWGRFSTNGVTPRAGDTVLPITFDPQDHALSCEIATLKMVLAYRGAGVPESTLIRLVGTDGVAKTTRDGELLWGDPNKGFVGNIDGRMPATGYGIYWEPIAGAARAYREASVIYALTPPEIAEQIREGNPLIVWGYLGSGERLQWRTPEDAVINAVLHEHTFVLHGFRGSVGDPKGFYLMDPIYGERYWDTDTFMDNWKALGYHGVAVY